MGNLVDLVNVVAVVKMVAINMASGLFYLMGSAVVLYAVRKLILAKLKSYASKTESKKDDEFIENVMTLWTPLKYVIMVFAFFAGIGVDLFAIAALLSGGAIGGVIGFKDDLADLVGSIRVFCNKRMALGDVLTFGPHKGALHEINLTHIVLRDGASDPRNPEYIIIAGRNVSQIFRCPDKE